MSTDAAKASSAQLVDEWRRQGMPEPPVLQESSTGGAERSSAIVVRLPDPVFALAWAIHALPDRAEVQDIAFVQHGDDWECRVRWQ